MNNAYSLLCFAFNTTCTMVGAYSPFLAGFISVYRLNIQTYKGDCFKTRLRTQCATYNGGGKGSTHLGISLLWWSAAG